MMAAEFRNYEIAVDQNRNLACRIEAKEIGAPIVTGTEIDGHELEIDIKFLEPQSARSERVGPNPYSFIMISSVSPTVPLVAGLDIYVDINVKIRVCQVRVHLREQRPVTSVIIVCAFTRSVRHALWPDGLTMHSVRLI
jgi:hypothetical protein